MEGSKEQTLKIIISSHMKRNKERTIHKTSNMQRSKERTKFRA